VPTNGLVKGYYIVVDYVGSEQFIEASTTSIPLADATYSVHVVKRPLQEIDDIFTILMMFFTIVAACLYYYVLTQQKGQALPEQVP
jgi:hypothetical protein